MKKQQFDFTKLIPVGAMAVALVSGYTMLQARVSNAESKLEQVDKLKDETAEIRVSQAKVEAKTDQILEYIKEIKQSGR